MLVGEALGEFRIDCGDDDDLDGAWSRVGETEPTEHGDLILAGVDLSGLSSLSLETKLSMLKELGRDFTGLGVGGGDPGSRSTIVVLIVSDKKNQIIYHTTLHIKLKNTGYKQLFGVPAVNTSP